MKISNFEALRAGQIESVTGPRAVTSAPKTSTVGQSGPGSPAAELLLSNEARAVASAKAAVDATPETRDDLVNRIKSQVDSGTYQVSGNDIAEQMVRRARADQLR